MRYNYKTSLVLMLTLCIAIITLSYSYKSNVQGTINYTLYKGERTTNRLIGEIDLALDANKNWDGRNFYVTFSECDNEQKIELEYCDDCDYKNLIAASNRYLTLDRMTKLPVIFEGDKLHSNFVKDQSTSRTSPIVYSIDESESLSAEIKKGIEEYKYLVPKLDLQDSDFYVAFNECADQRIAILGYCKGCAFKELIAATNRFIAVDENLQLPVIFESDRQHSSFFSSPDGIRIFITAEGYMVVVDKENKILSKGFTQY